jgi:hypothetical protein
MAAEDYTPVLVPGDLLTVRTAGRFHAGDPLEVAGPGEVQRAGAGSAAYVGIAVEDCPTGVQTVVMIGGAVQVSVADGPVGAGDLLAASDIPGRVIAVSGPPGPTLPPAVTAIAPASGSTLGGDAVTVTGSNFDLTAVVTIGAGTATAVVITADDTLTCLTPAGVESPPAADVTVTTSGGTATLPAAFTYTAPALPQVTGVAPPTGTTAGGTAVTVTGTELNAASEVTFGGVPATNVTVVDATTITCDTPPGAAGAVRVEVTTPAGTGGLDAAFTYTAAIPVPDPQSVTPNTGSTAGGTPVTIAGTGLSGATLVTFAGTAATGLTVVSDTELTCTTPPGAAGPVTVQVTTPGGIVPLNNGFTYTAPPAATLGGCAPASGPAGQTTPVTLTGTGLTGTTSVTFGGTDATGMIVDSATQIRCTAPALPAGSVTVVAVNPAGNGTLPAGFTYLAPPAPAITSVTPAAVSDTGGIAVAIAGTGFTGVVPASGVTFGGTPATLVTVDSDTSISCMVPAGTAGPATVAVTSPNGTGTSDTAFSYTESAKPAAIAPVSGSTAGGPLATVTGTGFTGATGFTIGGTAAGNFTAQNATTVTGNIPAGPAGAANVVVNSPNGSGTLPNGFTYITPPTITAVAPDTGDEAGGDTVVITGTGLSGATAVLFGSEPAAFTADSATQVTATTPAGTGTVDVVVGGVAGGPVTAAGAFTYTTTPLARAVQAEEPKPAKSKSKAKAKEPARTEQPEEQQMARVEDRDPVLPGRGDSGEQEPAADPEGPGGGQYMPRGPVIGVALSDALDGGLVRWLSR